MLEPRSGPVTVGTMTTPHRHILLLGSTGTIGRATGRALIAAGHRVSTILRPGPAPTASSPYESWQGNLTDPEFLKHVFQSAKVDAVISCLASRTGSPKDAWAVDYAANSAVLKAAQLAGINRFVLLSAICVQKPALAFQQAKLAFEGELSASALNWTIVRPTAFFKSLSGQVARVKSGKPFMVFGDGRLTACKPISDNDLGRFLSQSVTDPQTFGKILPIGGPGPAISPLDQVAMLEKLTGQTIGIKRMPIRLMDGIIGALSLLGRLSPKLAEKANLARIGRYYATESMLIWDGVQGRYDADATPEFGKDRLEDHYAALLRGDLADDRGAHAVW